MEYVRFSRTSWSPPPPPPGNVGSRSLRARWQWPQTVAVAEPCPPVARDPRMADGRQERRGRCNGGVDGLPVARSAGGGDSGVDKVGEMMGDCSVRVQLKYCIKYCELQHCTTMGGSGTFAGSPLVCGMALNLERLWKHD